MDNNLIAKIKMYSEEELKDIAKQCYEDDRAYPENFSNWYPHIRSFGKFNHSKIIATQIFTFEETEFLHKEDDINKVDWNRVTEILRPTLDRLKPHIIYSIKNGAFSNKFDFSTCMTSKEELAKNLWKINYYSTMYDTGGYTELVVREILPYCLDVDNPTIYNGMPLREEIRVFYNMKTKKIEYAVDYWDYDYCRDNLRSISDGIVFDWFHNIYGTRKIKHSKKVKELITRIDSMIGGLKFDGKLDGIWSIDFLWVKETDDIYLIDMARGFRSAYWNAKKCSDVL